VDFHGYGYDNISSKKQEIFDQLSDCTSLQWWSCN